MLRSFARTRVLTAVAAVVVLPLLTAGAPASTGGTTYEFTIRSQSTQTGNRESVVMKGRGMFADENARLEILDASGSGGGEMFGSKGSYFLLLDGGKKMILVDPAQKSYMEWDMQGMLAGMSKMMGALGGLVRMEMSDVKVEAQSMGSGGVVNGYSTQHVRLIQNYTMNAKVMGRSSTSRVETTTDYYFASELRALVNPFVQNSSAFTAMGDMFDNAEYKRQMEAVQSKLAGVPVKTVARSVTTNPDGKQETSIVTTEMTGFQNSDIAAATFAVPSGFQAVEMPKFDMPTLGGSADGEDGQSIGDALREGAAEGAKEGAREGAKDAAKDAAKGALGGLRGRIKK
jgi:hypothetical protein